MLTVNPLDGFHIKDRFIRGHGGEIVKLTQRESDIVGYLLQGRTAKETGIILNISSRTVEEHLKNIRLKTGLNFKSQIISSLIDESP